MSPVTFVVLTILLLLAIVGGLAGILLEARGERAQPALRNPAIRDALLPLAGWGSLFVLDGSVRLVGDDNLPTWFKHLLGTLAVLLFYYAVLATLRLVWRSARRIHARIRSGGEPVRWRAIPLLGRLAFPTMFVSAVLATVSVFLHDRVSLNFLFIACVLAALAIIRRRQPSGT